MFCNVAWKNQYQRIISYQSGYGPIHWVIVSSLEWRMIEPCSKKRAHRLSSRTWWSVILPPHNKLLPWKLTSGDRICKSRKCVEAARQRVLFRDFWIIFLSFFFFFQALSKTFWRLFCTRTYQLNSFSCVYCSVRIDLAQYEGVHECN